ncbi:hypothetical protein CAPTEDRAFT_220415 [Capitella teleta]|uniref:SGF29 C-terminal domain-containing protein n=1 Tax=Capitella teleta TaxID=283909 RepID=R7VDF0_CAPTE|nr:hypothetical protein CAPTEDRAFT_220415 [Capitella teleta]|eukprot:ELU13680.1 hypothetical protein CAPTEDRAFT_220415 [Capitella teleta]
MEQIFNYRIIIEKHFQQQKDLYQNLIDFKKPFNRVWHQGLLQVLNDFNINQELIQIVKALYNNAKSSNTELQDLTDKVVHSASAFGMQINPKMGRPKSSSGRDRHDREGHSKRDSSGGGGSSMSSSGDLKIKEMVKELHSLVHHVQDERDRGNHNLINIAKTHERMQQEQKVVVSPYFKTKLKGLYTTAMQDAETESELLRRALDKIAEIKTFKEKHGERPKTIMRRGVLMNLLQQNASSLPLWIGKPGERVPALCGATPAESNYIGKPGDKVAARVKSQDGEENWILAEIVQFLSGSNKYEVDDIDAEEGKERHTLSKRKVVPLPKWKANSETDSDALFEKDTLVLALYPQTTCFYRALIHAPPKKPSDEYSVLFEDNTYADGYSPPLSVAQRYVIACREEKKK